MSYGTDEPTQHQYPTGYLGTPPSSSTPTPAYRVGPPPRVGPQEYSTGHFPPPQGFPPVPPRRKNRSRTPELIAVAVVVLIALGLGAAWAIAKSSTPTAGRQPASVSCEHGTLPNGACAGGEAGPPANEPSLTYVPADMADADELYHYLSDAHLPCGPLNHIANPTLADTLIDCGPDVVLATYSSHAAAADQYNVLVSMMAGSEYKVHIAIGGNWTVSGEQDYVKKAAAALGGQYRTNA